MRFVLLIRYRTFFIFATYKLKFLLIFTKISYFLHYVVNLCCNHSLTPAWEFLVRWPYHRPMIRQKMKPHKVKTIVSIIMWLFFILFSKPNIVFLFARSQLAFSAASSNSLLSVMCNTVMNVGNIMSYKNVSLRKWLFLENNQFKKICSWRGWVLRERSRKCLPGSGK